MTFSIAHLNLLREEETKDVIKYFLPGSRILEIGAGTGRQAREISRHNFAVEAIDLPCSTYSSERLYPITDYDGANIPFPDDSFDIVFSSNVLEHICDLSSLHNEIKRVLAPGGYCIHIMPTHSWRFWTSLAGVPLSIIRTMEVAPGLLPRPPINRTELRRLWAHIWYSCKIVGGALVQKRHGERGNLVTELIYFHPFWWRRHFVSNGFAVELDRPMGMFYTGLMILAGHWSLERRRRAANWLGSACHLYKISPID